MGRGVLAAVLALTLLMCAPEGAGLRRISIGTNPVGTTYFVIGGGIAKLFTEELDIPSRALPHAGSSVYLPLLARGEITLGLNSTLDSALAYRGLEPYDQPLDVRALARVFVMPYGYFVKASSGIERLEQLEGKRVVVDLKGNVSLASLNWAIMATAGLGEGDIDPVSVGGIEQGVAAVTEGRADAAPIAIGTPLLRKAQAGIPGGVRILALGVQASDELLDTLAPGSRTFTIAPSMEHVGVDAPTRVAAFDTFVNVGSQLAPDDVQLLVQTLHQNWEVLKKDYPALRGSSAGSLAPATNPHPYAEGAIDYYRQAGLWSEANERQQTKVSR